MLGAAPLIGAAGAAGAATIARPRSGSCFRRATSSSALAGAGGHRSRADRRASARAAPPIRSRALSASRPLPRWAGWPISTARSASVPDSDGLAAVATHSLGLSARTVSGAEPAHRSCSPAIRRSTKIGSPPWRSRAASRSSSWSATIPAPATSTFTCSPSSPRAGAACAPRDLLTERLETGWTGWTLYAERDLEDTPLDCASCHRPDGAGRRAACSCGRLTDPGCTGVTFAVCTPPTACTDEIGRRAVDGTIAADGADLLAPGGWTGRAGTAASR